MYCLSIILSKHLPMHYETCICDNDAGTGVGPLAPQYIWQISQPFSNWGGQIIPTYYYWHPQCFSPSV